MNNRLIATNYIQQFFSFTNIIYHLFTVYLITFQNMITTHYFYLFVKFVLKSIVEIIFSICPIT